MESKPVKFNDKIQWELPDGTIHREEGPAVIMNSGTEVWCINDTIHRMDGPAYIYASGNEIWYINGHIVSGKIHQWAKEFNIDLDNLTDEDKQMLALYWGDYGK